MMAPAHTMIRDDGHERRVQHHVQTGQRAERGDEQQHTLDRVALGDDQQEGRNRDAKEVEGRHRPKIQDTGRRDHDDQHGGGKQHFPPKRHQLVVAIPGRASTASRRRRRGWRRLSAGTKTQRRATPGGTAHASRRKRSVATADTVTMLMYSRGRTSQSLMRSCTRCDTRPPVPARPRKIGKGARFVSAIPGRYCTRKPTGCTNTNRCG